MNTYEFLMPKEKFTGATDLEADICAWLVCDIASGFGDAISLTEIKSSLGLIFFLDCTGVCSTIARFLLVVGIEAGAGLIGLQAWSTITFYVSFCFTGGG